MKKRFPLLILLLLLSGSFLTAEINPVEYEKMQKAAPEQLIITVLRVTSRPQSLFSATKDVSANVRVDSVISSATGLSEGDTITIEYTSFKPGRGWVGPRPIPPLKKGESYPAFLIYDSESIAYIPAARGYSFSSLLVFR